MENFKEQFKEVLNRLKKPSVILSITSHIITILLLLHVNVDTDAVTGIVTAITSILVILGIISNPSTKNKGYGDDILKCSKCDKKTIHHLINGNLVCSKCGNVHLEDASFSELNTKQ